MPCYPKKSPLDKQHEVSPPGLNTRVTRSGRTYPLPPAVCTMADPTSSSIDTIDTDDAAHIVETAHALAMAASQPPPLSQTGEQRDKERRSEAAYTEVPIVTPSVHPAQSVTGS